MNELKKIKEIIKLSKLPTNLLRHKNPERCYNGRDLTKEQLIYQIVYLMDAPEDNA